MGSNVDLKMISIAVVIALIVGAGAGYMVGNSPVSSLMEERDQLEAEYHSSSLAVQSLEAELNSTQELLAEGQRNWELFRERYLVMLWENQEFKEQVIDLEVEIIGLQNDYQHMFDEYEELHDYYMELEEEYEKLNENYLGLLDTLNYLDAKNYSRTNNFNLTAGQSTSFTYDIGQGIIWKIDINFDGSKGWVGIYWRRGDQGGIITGGSDTLTEKIPYISGTANTEIYEDGDMINIFTSVMVTDFPSTSRTGHGRFQLDWTPSQPTIDGFAMLGEWPEFQDLRLDYWITYKLGKAADAVSWDTNDKIVKVSVIRDSSILYLCLKIPDDYVNDEHQVDGLDINIANLNIRKYIRWDANEIRITGTDGHGTAKYNYKDNTYFIELEIPIFSLIDLEIEISYVEATRYTVMGTFEESSYWVGGPLEVNKPEITVTDIPGIINGDFLTSTEGRSHEPEGWIFGGSGWMNRLGQWEHGTDLSQTVTLDSSVDGIGFWIEPQPSGEEVSLELYVNEILFYSNSFSGPDSYFESSRVIIPLDTLYFELGDVYEIRFHVLPGPKTGAHIVIDNVTFVEFS